MERYSISFTLGKASDPHGANIAHNNRKFTAANVCDRLTSKNIVYAEQSVRDAYEQLFGQALAEYNAKQKQPCRRIHDYYDHICSGKREEPYYEIVVQFGDVESAPCGSERGKIAAEMLGEYMKNFQMRNPNLHVFNAVLHLDEASPHLHIDFVPFYSQKRTRGLSKGVSMRAALSEQGFQPKGIHTNQLVLWEEHERNEMERILQQRGYEREDKNAHYAHMTVEDYKFSKDEKKLQTRMRELMNVSTADATISNIQTLRLSLNAATERVKFLENERQSPYKSFFYSSREKQAWMIQRLDEMDIPYHETDTGFEAQECYVDTIRKIEKEYVAPKTRLRDQLRDDIDRCSLKARTIDDLCNALEELGYTIKHGTYLAAQPADSSAFIRTKSLGEYYTENALRNRIKANLRYERDISRMLNEAKRTEAPTYTVIHTMCIYMTAIKQFMLPFRKKNPAKTVVWTNDAELDTLLALNNRVSNGMTLESLRKDLAEKEKTAAEKADALIQLKEELQSFYDMRERLEILFDGKKSNIYTIEQAKGILKEFPSVNATNWKNVYKLIEDQENELRNANVESEQAQEQLREAAGLVTAMERIMTGSYVQAFVRAEHDRRMSDTIPNGMQFGSGSIRKH